MQASNVARAVAAARSSASALDLRVDDAVVLHDSNRLAVRLLPCDVLARVASVAHQAGAEFEVEVARRLGEPHPGNLLRTRNGLLFTDWETCCRGPVEFDIAHVPDEVSEHYRDADQDLLRECRVLMLAMIATWRWDRDDQFPNGRRLG